VARKKLFFLILLYVFFIYSTLPFAPYIVDGLRFLFGENFGYVISGTIIFALSLIAFAMRNYLVSARTIFWLVFLSFTGVCITILMEIPAERIHFLEYGILGLSLTRLWDKPKGYFLAFIFGSLVGLVDELIQGVLQVQTILPLPKRYFEWKDVGMNIFGVFLGIVFERYVIDEAKNLRKNKNYERIS